MGPTQCKSIAHPSPSSSSPSPSSFFYNCGWTFTTLGYNYIIQQVSLAARSLANIVNDEFNHSPLIPPPLTRRVDVNFVWTLDK